MLTSTGVYAIRAMVGVARQPVGRFVHAVDLGNTLPVPEHYLTHVLGTLTKAKLLEARRGRGVVAAVRIVVVTDEIGVAERRIAAFTLGADVLQVLIAERRRAVSGDDRRGGRVCDRSEAHHEDRDERDAFGHQHSATCGLRKR